MRKLALVAAALALVACATEEDTTMMPTITSASPTSDAASTPDAGHSEGISARGVLLASVLLVYGDVEQALADGLVTSEEVDAAAEALESGTLDSWAALAED